MIYRGRNLQTLVILGCGATRGASFVGDNAACLPPVDADFFEQLARAAKHGSIASQAKTDLDDAIQAASLPTYEGVGMEDYFVRAEFTKALRVHMATSDGGDKSHRRGHYAEPVVTYRKAIAALLLETTARKRCEYHRLVAGALEAGDTLVNFNYDTVMDNAMEQAPQVQVDLGHRCTRLRDVRNVLGGARQDGRAFLLHLHGSLNWSVHCDGLDPTRDFKYDCIDSVSVTGLGEQDPTKVSPDGLERCFIVPPLWTKPIAGCQLLENLWALARMAVRKCRRLIVIGYSMPKTDQLTNYLFEIDTNLNSSEQLEELIVVNPSYCIQDRIIRKLEGTRKEPPRDGILREDDTLEKFANSISSYAGPSSGD